MIHPLLSALKHRWWPRLRRFGVWCIFSSAIAGAAKFGAGFDASTPTGEAPLADVSADTTQWDQGETWWNPDANLDELTERYTGERPFRLVTLGGYNLQTTALQPSEPHRPFSSEVGPAPVLEPEPSTEIPASFQNAPVELADTAEISGSAEYVAPEGVFVGGEISGFLGEVVYLSSGESNFALQFSAVPEPTTGGLLVLSLLGFAARRRRR